jgi:hypothetical protein
MRAGRALIDRAKARHAAAHDAPRGEHRNCHVTRLVDGMVNPVSLMGVDGAIPRNVPATSAPGAKFCFSR